MKGTCLDSTLEARLLKKVTKTEGCWLWFGATVGRGYGSIGTSKGIGLAHRVAYELYNGPIPAGALVLHECDVPNCVNPKHLFIGDNTDNMRDMMTKGRGNKPRGEQITLAKLTEGLVRMIRTSSLSNRDLADICKVNICTVQRARASQTWKHI